MQQPLCNQFNLVADSKHLQPIGEHTFFLSHQWLSGVTNWSRGLMLVSPLRRVSNDKSDVTSAGVSRPLMSFQLVAHLS